MNGSPRLTPAVLGIIPARAGSKGIPHKNIAQVAGKPLIGFTIQAALAAKTIERVLVSTDSPEIASLARDCGAEVPFLRAPAIAQDSTPGIEPVLHAVRWLEDEQQYCPHYVMVLQPTSPLRTAQDIEAAIQLAEQSHAEAVVSVVPVHHHPYWMKRIDERGLLADFHAPADAYPTRQQLPPAYALNGAIYLIRRAVLLERGTLCPARTYAYVMPPERSLDVDSPWDLYLAELVLRDRISHERD